METGMALVLFAHGARDPDWAQPLLRLRDAVQAVAPHVPTRLCFLEMQGPDLPTVLEDLQQEGATRIAIAPIFWSRGGHVAKDLPVLIEAFRARHPGLELNVLPALSDLPDMHGFIARALAGLLPGAAA